MSYQPPGPYPVFPQYPGPAGMPPKPPAPQTVLRAHYCMLAGGALSIIAVIVAAAETNAIRTVLVNDDPTASNSTINSLATAAIVVAVVFGLVEMGLWVWMAFATKAGKNWARILSTVFFGLNATSAVFGSVAFVAASSSGSTTTFASSDTALGQVTAWLEVLVGLAAIILLWNKASTPYFRPMAYYPGPYGYPGMPPGPAPYQYPVMPQQPQQQQQQPQGPGDPWGTPPQG